MVTPRDENGRTHCERTAHGVALLRLPRTDKRDVPMHVPGGGTRRLPVEVRAQVRQSHVQHMQECHRQRASAHVQAVITLRRLLRRYPVCRHPDLMSRGNAPGGARGRGAANARVL